MGKGEKYAAMVVGLAMATTLVLPGRQTPAVFSAFGKAVSRILGTAMGTGGAGQPARA